MKAQAPVARTNVLPYHSRPRLIRIITPNRITFGRLLMVIPIIGFLLEGHAILATWGYIIASLTDALDGWLARRYRMVTTTGAWFDPLVDKIFGVGLLLVAISLTPTRLWAISRLILYSYLALELTLLLIRPIKRAYEFWWSCKIGHEANPFGKLKVWCNASSTVASMLPQQAPWLDYAANVALAFGLVASVLSFVGHTRDIWRAHPSPFDYDESA